ncbi:TonB-dependent receptor [Oceanispirochaeta crateris]|uniref:TonB-dependent receptor n=1 Tax=Oceanispirochaeta crateris TaxID=2518645 RepID=A0A5C1QMF2_9SPIO|nr:TonB-dependent receptor [Oceanispirochaeta crateris]QEN08687.1 TonB-dependent receptor [Oceanispirochaeta crateris]
MKPCALLMIGMLLTHPLWAQESAESPQSEKIIITGERSQTDTASGQKTVIDKESWERMGARTVTEALQVSPGVTVNRSGTTLEPSTVSIRGSSGQQVLILVNGVPQNSGKGNAVNLNSFSLNDIEQIEVIRGGNSAVYGEGAFGGVINIITRQETSYIPEGGVYFSAGSFETYGAGGWIKGPLSPGGTLTGDLSLDGRYTGGEYDYPQAEGSQIRTNSQGEAFNGKAGLSWNRGGMDSSILTLEASLYRSSRGVPGIMEFLTPEAQMEESRESGSLGWVLKSPSYKKLTLDTEISVLHQSSSYENPAASIEDNNDNLSLRGRVDGSAIFEMDSWVLTPFLGTVLDLESLESTSLRSSNGTSLPGKAEQFSSALYARVEASNALISLTPALRWDQNKTEYKGWEVREDSKGSWSLTATLTPFPEEKISLKGNVGTAYHNPGFDDLFWSSGSFASGNPDLLPEESFNWDSGLYYSPWGGVELSIIYFQSHTENLIQWSPTAGGTWRPGNIGMVLSQGLENTLSWLIPLQQKSLSFIELKGNYTWMTVRDQTADSINKGNQLPYRPLHAADGSISFLRKNSSLTGSIHTMGYRFTNAANTKYLDSLLTFDAVFKTSLEKGFTFTAGVLNLGNLQYVDKLGYPVPGREWTITGGYNF